MDGVMNIAGIDAGSDHYVVEVLNSKHTSFGQFQGNPPDANATTVAAKYITAFLRTGLRKQDTMTWDLFYNDECKTNPIVSLKYSSKRPSWWYNEVSLCGVQVSP